MGFTIIHRGEIAMPRAKFDMAEVDGNLKIEDGVRRTLTNHSIARVPAKGIEKVYDLFDEQAPSEQLSLREKCRAIAEASGADYFEIRGPEVWFRKKPFAPQMVWHFSKAPVVSL
jgi:hypothetical protein